MRHKFKSIDGAVRRIRELEKIVEQYEKLAARLHKERNTMAMLAADGPTFFNPLVAMEAKSQRDAILRTMGLNGDGSFRNTGTTAQAVPA